MRCGACGEQVSVRYTFDGEPVFWTCERHGIRDEGEVYGSTAVEVVA